MSRAAGPCAARRRRDPGRSACRDRSARPSARPQRAAARSAAVQRSSLPSLTMSAAEALAERLGHLLAHLVAARPDRRPDGGGELAPPSAAHAVLDDPVEQAAPARVEDGERPARRRSSARSRSARSRPRARASACPGSSVQSPSPGTPRLPASARLTVVEWRCRLSVSSSGSAPASAHTRRRFSSTQSASSPVTALPRFSDSNGPSLTPPCRVVKTTSYGPGASQRRSHGASISSRAAASSDSRPSSSPFSFRRRSSARISPTRGDSPRPSSASSAPPMSSWTRRETVEVLVQRPEVGECEGQERRVGMVGLGQADDFRRRQPSVAQPLCQDGAVHDGRRDVARIPLGQLEPVEKGVYLLARRARARVSSPSLQAGTSSSYCASRSRSRVNRSALSSSAHEPWMDWPRPTPGCPASPSTPRPRARRAARRAPPASAPPTIARPTRRQWLREQATRVLDHPEAEPALVAHRAEDARRVVDERLVVEDTDDSLVEVGLSAVGIDELAVPGRLQREGHRVDREVAAEEILLDRLPARPPAGRPAWRTPRGAR